ncbi:MAG: hypothetical protein Q7U99_03050 [Rubrivivax sp.]|nr:hypothetical protein [Rubrivivax sp.]
MYDLLLTEGLARSLAALDPISADVLALKGGAAEFLAEVITRQLGAKRNGNGGKGDVARLRLVAAVDQHWRGASLLQRRGQQITPSARLVQKRWLPTPLRRPPAWAAAFNSLRHVA